MMTSWRPSWQLPMPAPFSRSKGEPGMLAVLARLVGAPSKPGYTTRVSLPWYLASNHLSLAALMDDNSAFDESIFISPPDNEDPALGDGSPLTGMID
ncbi:hypothetical protein A0J61_11622 [Choanephora cucurbitarum]|uniref:Uncharacterized protein n=1 Tax=Choanephora cucurbitarum TaxID=101091 RepID=A0A1C7MU61_9FUNG|nr:hypothetical protein A0J61_11622 [Choanephora cucurbitarum]